MTVTELVRKERPGQFSRSMAPAWELSRQPTRSPQYYLVTQEQASASRCPLSSPLCSPSANSYAELTEPLSSSIWKDRKATSLRLQKILSLYANLCHNSKSGPQSARQKQMSQRANSSFIRGTRQSNQTKPGFPNAQHYRSLKNHIFLQWNSISFIKFFAIKISPQYYLSGAIVVF